MNVDPLEPVLIGCGKPADAHDPYTAPDRVGFKAHNLARMHALGLRVPPAFVLGTAWSALDRQVDPAVWRDPLARLEQACALRFGDERRPLLLSVRSGARVSMPGMLDTVLNIGLTERTIAGHLLLLLNAIPLSN